MIKENAELFAQAEHLVRHFYKKNRNKDIVFHTLDRTMENLEYCDQVLTHYNLSENETFSLKCAILFAYCGFQLSPADQTDKGIEAAKGFLSKMEIDQNKSGDILTLLSHDGLGQEGILSDIYHDIMTRHLGSPDYFKQAKRIKTELKFSGKYIRERRERWKAVLEEFMDHHFRAEFCRLSLSGQKAANMEIIRNKIRESDVADAAKQETPAPKKLKPARGVQTMFRITSGNNQRLSDMADKKAHILITVNSIILSAIISLVLRRLEHSGFLIVPSLILLSSCLITMIISILATRPKIPLGTFQPSELNEKSVNLLYFGNFYNMDETEYTDGMNRVMNDSEFLYRTLIKDVYTQGVVLGRKYQLLRMAYNVFMYGLIVSILFFIAFSVMRYR